ncbi:MAG: 1-deoxy-D-xylulose-5-phosphate synthase [Planctomycetota bacterium]|jgi:1-deoxy-D-xylulose-5-phosphate synthase
MNPIATTSLLERIQTPADLKLIPANELEALSEEIRSLLIETIGKNGGHLASNLGMVELTVALHRVFDFMKDFLIFDVSHQCYVHKLLTGRRDGFPTLRTKDGLSGFTDPKESKYDLFKTGHACTSISSAVGLAIASRLHDENRTAVAIIGDGSIGGGMAFEALNHAGHTKENVLVILNDNDMAIAETVGALSGYLSRIRTEPLYHRVRDNLFAALKKVPWIGHQLDWFVEAGVDAIKQVIEPGHIFTELGFEYYGPIDGHDLPLLIEELEKQRRLTGPRLLHVTTQKGKGYEDAEKDPETFHSASPFYVQAKSDPNAVKRPGYTRTFAEALLTEVERDETIIAITAAMPQGTGLNAIAERFPDRYLDVGICEEHAVTMAAGLAKGGCKPVVVIYSTFLQRGYDQIFHDVCLQPDLPVIFALDRGGLVGSDGPTHHGVYDIAMLRHLPNMVLMAPRDGEELAAMLELALGLNRPVAIRYPRASIPEPIGNHHTVMALGKSEPLRQGDRGTVLAYGEMVQYAFDAAELAAKKGVELNVINLRFAKPLDEEAILTLAKEGGPVFTVEDGTIVGGVGSAVTELLSAQHPATRVIRLGLPDHCVPHAERGELLHDLGLDAEGLCATFLAELETDS